MQIRMESNTHFASQWGGQHFNAFRFVGFFAKYIHQFRDCSFGGDVGAADDTRLFQKLAGLILSLSHPAAIAL